MDAKIEAVLKAIDALVGSDGAWLEKRDALLAADTDDVLEEFLGWFDD